MSSVASYSNMSSVNVNDTKNHQVTARSLCMILFDFNRSIWCSVLPYCFLNCTLMAIVEVLRLYDIKIAFSMNGHNLMTLLISYLVVAKINLSYDRYMKSRHAIGTATATVRELCQLVNMNSMDGTEEKVTWQKSITEYAVEMLDSVIRVLLDDVHPAFLARNAPFERLSDDDPLSYVQALRTRLYRTELQILERVKIVDMLNEFTRSYRTLLELASTPMPFPLVQMARTFLFLWTFTIPFTLRGVIQEFYVAEFFVFFLTYGFIGLEIVSMKLMFPFTGDGVSDFNIIGMREATVRGILSDISMCGLHPPKLYAFGRKRPREPSMEVPSQIMHGMSVQSSRGDYSGGLDISLCDNV